MNESPPQRFTLGSSSDCNVVIPAEGIGGLHCELISQNGNWVVVPRDAKVGMRKPGQSQDGSDGMVWTDVAFRMNPDDDVWLTESIRLPWPARDGSLAQMSVGRATDCAITLPERSISGRHAEVIIGPRRTVVLRDLRSRNGLYTDASLQRRVESVMLIPGQTVYFGSVAVPTAELLRQAKAILPLESQAESRLVTDRSGGKVPSQQGSTIELAMPSRGRIRRYERRWDRLAGIFTILLIPAISIGTFRFFYRDEARVENEPQEPRLQPVDVDAPLAVTLPEPVDASPAASSVESGSPTLTPESKPQPDDASTVGSIDDAVYWITIRQSSTGNRFRLGSGTAIRPDLVVTTASIIESARAMLKEGFDTLSVVSIHQQDVLEAKDYGVFHEFGRRMMHASEMRARYDATLQADAGPAGADERKTSIALVNAALQSVSAADVGWIRVVGLPSCVEVGVSTSYRPGQQLLSVSARFDSGDPFLDLDQQPPIRHQLSRIEAVGVSQSDLPGVLHLQLTGPDSVPENLIGTPLVRENRIAGMIVFQSRQHGRKVEAVTGQTLQLAIDTVEK